ncbi:MAG: protein kinase, partial [Chromatiales bacterium]|nr:protein kinase [Chromatiales bacterium]
MARSTDILPTGHLLSWYRVDGVLGTGGFGITYLAHDTHLDQQVAIKEYFPSDFAERQDDTTVLPRSDEHDELYEWGLKSFMSEAKTMARFHHQSIVRVLSVFPEHGTAYMVMEYERGQSLAQALRGAKTWDESALMRLVEAISGALREIHEAGFIHRDIKPDN